MKKWKCTLRRLGFSAFLVFFLQIQLSFAQNWSLARNEDFTTAGVLSDQEVFGDRGWLTTRIRNGGAISVSGGFANVQTPDFRDSALIRIVESLPDEYKLRIRLGNVDYAWSNYESSDYVDPDFKYSVSNAENGFYWLTLTDREVEDSSGESWWHKYRKIVVDSDDHVGTTRPLYMVYMNPDLDRSAGNWIYGQSELLRCWSNSQWYTNTWNWEVAFTYQDNTFYEVEIEKYADFLTMRTFDALGNPIELADPVDLDLIYGMGENRSEFEYAYFGEPHIDSYEGQAQIDSISLWVINSAPTMAVLPDQEVAPGNTLSFSLNAEDDTFLDTLTYSAQNLPDGAELDSGEGTFHWTPSSSQIGTYEVDLFVTDSYGAQVSGGVRILVDPSVPSGNGSSLARATPGGCGQMGFPGPGFFISVILLFTFLRGRKTSRPAF